jgi:ubiquitin-like modifier-activating enzyme ATG7
MPGHSAGSTPEALASTLENFHKLEELVKTHDTVFLLMDSREARWLPAVLAGVHNKICMTVALGFDTYVVMRHGMPSEFHDPTQHGNARLGCYFCNDVVAPRNSLRDRTLDQQCTVSRPALCQISSAYSIELLTSMLQHPLKQGAPANENMYDCARSCLGLIP